MATIGTEFGKTLGAQKTHAKSGRAADYLFDVSAEMCKALSGFRHDQHIDGVDGDASQH